jgi:hypothetical protein
MRTLLAVVALSICTPLVADTPVSDADAQKMIPSAGISNARD